MSDDYIHTHFEFLSEDSALSQRGAVPAAIAELKLTLVQAHLGAFSYDYDGVRPALADCPLSGSQAWDLVTDDACTQSYHRGKATGGDTETGYETWRKVLAGRCWREHLSATIEDLPQSHS